MQSPSPPLANRGWPAEPTTWRASCSASLSGLTAPAAIASPVTASGASFGAVTTASSSAGSVTAPGLSACSVTAPALSAFWVTAPRLSAFLVTAPRLRSLRSTVPAPGRANAPPASAATNAITATISAAEGLGIDGFIFFSSHFGVPVRIPSQRDKTAA